MADINQLLNNALNMGNMGSPTDTKKQEVASAADQKKAAFGGTPDFYQMAAANGGDAGLASAGQLETDLRTLNQGQLWAKYGEATPELLRQMAGGQQAFSADQGHTRTGAEAFGDSVSGVASGFVGGLGSIAALGVGLVDDEAGAAMAEGLNKLNQVVQGSQSGAVNAARRVQAARSRNTSRDNELKHAQDIANGDSEVFAGLKQFGRDFVDTLGNSTDPTFLAQGTAEAVGSLLAGSPVAAGLRKIGTAVMGGAARQRAVTLAAELDRATGVASTARASDVVRRAGGASAWPLATAALEGGGAYTGAVNEVMGMTHEQLEAGSQEYRDALTVLLGQGVPFIEAQEQAKITVANQAGKQAAAIQAPIAGVTGLLTRSLEKPFNVPSLGSAARTALVNEPFEEAIQSSTGQLAQNIGVQNNADQSLNLAKGVGEQGAQGALFGMTSAGAVQGPAAAPQAVAMGGRALYLGTRSLVSSAANAAKPLTQAIMERGDRILRQHEKASPVSEEAVITAASGLNANADAAANVMAEALNTAAIDEAVKTEGNEYISSLVRVMRFDLQEMEGATDSMKRAVEGATSRAEAIAKMAREVNKATTDQDVLNNAAVLWMLMEPVRSFQEADPVAFNSLPKDSPALEPLRQYNWVVNNIENNPTVQRALRAVSAMLSKDQVAQNIRPVTEESLSTPQGQQNVQNAIAVASLHPDKGNLDANEQILTHAAQGRLNLSPMQLKTLKASVNLLRARAKMEEQIAASGIRRAKDVVSSQIVSGNDPLRADAKSALQHTQHILSAMRGQNTELAIGRLEDFGKFVQHMQNKVGALNTHFSNGNPNADGVQYQQLQPGSRAFKLSKDGMYVNMNKGSSIDQAQSVALEAEILADVYNGLVETFPELGLPVIPATKLDASLVGNAEDIAAGFRAARQTVKAAAPARSTPKQDDKIKNAGGFVIPEATLFKDGDGGQSPWLMKDGTVIGTGQDHISFADAMLPNGAVAYDDFMRATGAIRAAFFVDAEEGYVAMLHTHVGQRLSAEQLAFMDRLNKARDGKLTIMHGQADGLVNPTYMPVTLADLKSLPATKTTTAQDKAQAPAEAAPSNGEAPATQPEENQDGNERPVVPARTVRVGDRSQEVSEASQKAEPADAGTSVDSAGTLEDGGTSTPEPVASVRDAVPDAVGDSKQTAPMTPLAALYQGKKNFVQTSFSYPETPISRLVAEDSPIVSVRRALSSELRLTAFLSGSTKRNTLDAQTASAYQRLLTDTLEPVYDAVHANLASFLASSYSSKIPDTMQDIFLNDKQVPMQDGGVLSGADMNRLARAKVLNLVQEDGNGGLVYQPQMLEQAALAAMQWLLSADSFTSVMDESDVADMTGLPELTLQRNPELIEDLTQGISLAQAKRSLSDKIRKYWGLVADKNADLAYTDGIPEAMAAEMLRAMDDAGLIELNTIKLTPTEHGVDAPKDFIRVIPQELADAEVLANFKDAIEVASLVEPEHTNYVGDEVPPVAQRQMNNPGVANTTNQKDALTKEQQTPFYVNPMMVGLYTSIGRDGLLSLFGETVSDPDVYNDNHLKTVEGRNTAVVAAFDHLLSVVADVSNAADTASTALDQMPVRFAYNMSRVGRMQMLGRYSPQASKLMREAVLPTRSTLDLSNQNSETFNAYGLALAQAVGIKVHNQPIEDSVREVMAMLNGPLSPAVEALREWYSSTDLSQPTELTAEVDPALLKAAFKAADADLSFVGLHAVMDYARFLATDDVSAYETSLYLEADGVTNGPINAMALMSIGNFTPAWVANMSKGGLAFGSSTTMADIRRSDSKDLYQASTDAARARLSELRDTLGQDGSVQMDHLLDLMSLFNKDVLFDPNTKWEDGSLELKRGVAKNPLTITIYGSGERGIAGKLTSSLVSEIYARMSTLLQATKADPQISPAQAMFPNDPNADEKLKRFSAAVTSLTTFVPKRQKGVLVFDRVHQPSRNFVPKTFGFTVSELEAMEANMLELFVKPMRQGIADTVGEPLMKAVGVLRDAAQVQSIFLQKMYIDAVDAALAEKEANDPNWRRGDFLSENDLKKISDELRSISPLVQTGDQTFLISGQESFELEGRDLQYSRALNGRLRTDPAIYAPAQAGVRAIPMMTIGMGDGMMMQLLAQQGLEGTLKIFDGMNMPLNKIKDYSAQANAAVYESWKGNPHAEMLKTFDKFMGSIKESSITEPMMPALVQTLFSGAERQAFRQADVSPTPAQIMERIKALRGNLEWSAKSIDARHAAIESLPVSVDQMAAAAQPFTNGRQATGRMTIEQATAALNAAYQAAMNGGAVPAAAPLPAVTPVAKKIENAIDQVGRVSSTGVRVLSPTAIENLARTAMTEAQKEVFGEIRRSMAAQGYKVVAGTPEQLDAYIAANGLAARPTQKVHGWINVGDKTIFMVNPTTETLVHELVHAASYETILAHYRGDDLGANQKEVADAVERLELLMEEFLEQHASDMPPPLRAAFDSANAAILSSNLESDQAVAQAKALNEFMAWALTNEQLTKDLKQKKAPAIVVLAKKALAAIKKLIWGRKVAPKVADDFLSNLQFNAGIIFRTQPTIGAVVRDGELFHSTAYGNSDRLTAVRQTFAQKIADLLSSEKWQRGVKMRQVEVSEAVMDAVEVGLSFNAHGFPMTQQESSTFRMILTALATEADIDPNAMARAQELYTHVAKNLSVEDFMADPDSLDPQMRYDAQERYSVIMGQYLTKKDAKGRSSLLPSFLALATVNDDFRAVLAKMKLPVSVKNKDGSLDAVLENVGTNVMDSLSRRLSGDAKSNSVRDSVDNLLEHIRKIAQDDQTFFDQYASAAGGIVDRANDIVTAGLEAASSALLEKSKAAEKNASNALTRTVARFGQLTAAVVSEKNGAVVAEGLMAATNASKVWEPVRTLIGDLVGRTESNANVYDMIKAVRSAVQQSRQQFRDGVPQIINEKFKKKVTPAQWTAMFNVLGKTDIAALRSTGMSHADVANLIADQTARDNLINTLENQIQTADPQHWPVLSRKMKQLATFMNTGVPGVNLLRNAEAISRLLGEKKSSNFALPNAATKAAIDKLITVYALDSMSSADRDVVSSLVQSEATGVNFVLDYLVGQRKEEVRKATGTAMLNAYKGYLPSEQEAGVSMQVASDADFGKLRELGYVRVANYGGSSVEYGQSSKGYYLAPLSGRAVFNQGIMQNVRHTAGGVDATSGFTIGMTAGRVTSKQQIARIMARMSQEKNTVETFLPVYDSTGEVIALERSVDPQVVSKLNKSTDLAKMIGVWRGRQAEEAMSQVHNEKLIDNLKAMFDKDMQESSSNKAQYINLLSPKTAKDNPVIADAVSLFTNETLAYIREKFGDEFWVRRDMVRDAIGERSASVGDMWNGVSNISKDNRDQIRRLMVGAFGVDAYRYAVTAERMLHNFMSDMRTIIVVKSVIVPAANFVANIYQLISRGVALGDIAKGMPAKLGEIDSYAKTRLRQIEVEAELRAATGNAVAERKLKTELQSITDAHKRMSIWPLIEAGEFSSISDVGLQHEDLELTSGKLSSYIEKQVNKLPDSVKTAGRYALITKDTALFRGLQKSVQYGDFIAKAVLYEHLTKKKGLSKAEALARITEEFVNYDRLPGRFRSYLENSGLLWFYNFKIRSTKVALSTIRNNPAHALVAMTLPAPDFLGSIGSPISDNIVAKALSDTLGSSVGMDMAFRAPSLNPWMNLIH